MPKIIHHFSCSVVIFLAGAYMKQIAAMIFNEGIDDSYKYINKMHSWSCLRGTSSHDFLLLFEVYSSAFYESLILYNAELFLTLE